MKRFTAFILILSLMSGCLMTSCSNSGREDRGRRSHNEEDDDDNENDEEDDDEDDEDDPGSIIRPTNATEPLFQTQSVDETMRFDTIYADPVDTPWVLENNIPFSTMNYINTYFNPFLVNYMRDEEIPTDVLNSIATIYRPTVRHYPAEEPGYTVYEINYTEYFPARMVMPGGTSPSISWWYHDVQYVDYYTGTIYPYINMDSYTNSYCVYGDIVYEGQTYTVYHYSFRDYAVTNDEIVTDSSGRDVWEYDEEIYMTDYFIVPDGYDGIVMCVFTTDDTYMTFDELLAQSYPYYVAPHVFDDPEYDEYLRDYDFWSIAELG